VPAYCITTDITPITRSTSISNASLTDLWIWEGTTLLAHQVNTDADFGSPTITLTYGTHPITIIASKATGQSLTNGIWTCTKLSDTYASASEIAINATSSNTHTIELNRRISKVQFTTTDNIPTNVSKVYIKVESHRSIMADLTGTDTYNYEATVNVSSKQGQTYSNFIHTLTESPTEEEDCQFLIRWLSADDAVLYEYERTLKVKANRCTNLTGNFFDSEGMAVAVSTEWDTQVDVPLFSSE